MTQLLLLNPPPHRRARHLFPQYDLVQEETTLVMLEKQASPKKS
jgi:hypothetical protein